jgi:hypothetical protein
MMGKKYHRLTVLSDAETSKQQKMILCLCECGREKKMVARKVLHGKVKSCGCLQNDIAGSGCRKRNTISKWASPLDKIDEDII